MIASKFQLPFFKKEKLNNEVYTFYFDRKNFKFKYYAGQYFRLTLSIQEPDSRGSSRYFTISSSPNDRYLTITTKIIKSSFKIKLNSLVKGDMVTFFGPFGDMYQDKKDMTTKIMLAGGMGLTPAYSMLKFIDEEKLKVKFSLLVSFANKKEAVFFEQLKKIASKNPNTSVIYTLTKEKKNSDFEIGRIDQRMILKHMPDINSAKIFLGGPPKMVFEMEKIVKKMGVSENKLIIEDFSGY